MAADQDLGDLVATVVADFAQFRTDFQQLAKDVNSGTARVNRSLSTMEKATTTMSGAFATAARFAGVFGVALSARALINFTRNTFEMIDSLSSMSARINVSVEALSELQYAAKLTDTDFGAVTGGMQFLSRQLSGALATGTGNFAKLLKELNLEAKTLAGQKLDQTFQDVLTKIVETGTVTDEMRQATTAFGRGFGTVLLQLGPQLAEFRGEARALNVVISTEMAAAVDAASKNIDRLGMVVQAEMTRAVSEFATLIISLTNVRGEFKGLVTDWKPFVNAVATGIGMISDSFHGWRIIIGAIDTGVLRIQSKWLDLVSAVLGTVERIGSAIKDAFNIQPTAELIQETEEQLARARASRTLPSGAVRALEEQLALLQEQHAAELKLAGATGEVAAQEKTYVETLRERADALREAADVGQRDWTALAAGPKPSEMQAESLGRTRAEIEAEAKLTQAREAAIKEAIENDIEMARISANQQDRMIAEGNKVRELAELREKSLGTGGTDQAIGALEQSLNQQLAAQREAEEARTDSASEGEQIRTAAALRSATHRVEIARAAVQEEIDQEKRLYAAFSEREIAVQKQAREVAELRKRSLGEESAALIDIYQQRLDAQLAATLHLAASENAVQEQQRKDAVVQAEFMTALALEQAEKMIALERKRVEDAMGIRQLEREMSREMAEMDIGGFLSASDAMTGAVAAAFEERLALQRQFNAAKNDLERQDLQNAMTLAEEHLTLVQNAAQAEMAIRQQVVDAAIGLLQALGSKHRGAAIAALAIQKALAIQQIIINAQQAMWMARATLPPGAADAQVARLAIMAKISAGLVAATGLVEAKQLSSGGTQATRGTTANPLVTQSPTAVQTASGGATGIATRSKSTEVIFQGDFYGFDDMLKRKLIDALREAIDDRDMVIIGRDSRQASLLGQGA